MTTDTLPKACVILGAGASYDVWDRGATLINKEFRPPLAADLFDIPKHPPYQEILSVYPGAHVLAQQLASRLSSGVLSLEEALRSYSNDSDPRVREHFKHVPAYLRDLIFRASNEYVDIPSWYIQLVHSLLSEYPHQLLFLTLNYDDLLEKALGKFDQSLIFSDIVDYTAEHRQVKVVKLHGSTNWFSKLVGQESDWEGIVRRADVIRKPADDEILVLNNIRTVMGAEHLGNALYPVITAPLAGKDPGDTRCTEEHLTVAQDFLKTCKKFLVVGTGGLDDDLLDILDGEVPEVSRPFLHIVGGKNVDQVANRFYNGVKAFARVNRTVKAKPATYPGGFREYVTGEGIRTFAQFEQS